MDVKITYTHGKTRSFHILHELTASSYNSNDSTVRNSLFGAVRLMISMDVITFAVHMSSSVHIDNKK